jgi:hypothetical protein
MIGSSGGNMDDDLSKGVTTFGSEMGRADWISSAVT